MPLNPGPRHPVLSATQQVVVAARKNAVIVAYSIGFAIGALLTLGVTVVLEVVVR